VDTYPEADRLQINNVEFRQWTASYEKCWDALDAKYKLSSVRKLEDILPDPDSDSREAVELKGDIVALYFYDRLFRERKVLQETKRPDIPLTFKTMAPPLFTQNETVTRLMHSNTSVRIDSTGSKARVATVALGLPHSAADSSGEKQCRGAGGRNAGKAPHASICPAPQHQKTDCPSRYTAPTAMIVDNSRGNSVHQSAKPPFQHGGFPHARET